MPEPTPEIFHWNALAPEIGVVVLALLVLFFEIALPVRLRRFVPVVVLAGLAALVASVVPDLLGVATNADATAPVVLFSGMIAQTGGVFSSAGPSTAVARLFFLASAFFTVWLGVRFLRKRALPETAFLHILLVVTATLMLLPQSHHFVLFYVLLETAAIGLCILAGYDRENGASLEAGIKYLITNGLGSALLLLGIVLLYGATGNPTNGVAGADVLDFGCLRGSLAAHRGDSLALAGVALVIAGIAGKIGVFPFQLWVPDVYQGAPTPVTAFFATASKTAGIFALLLLINGPFAPLLTDVNNAPGALYVLLMLMTGGTLLFANLTALGQTNVKRLMGLSGMSRTGFALLAVLAATHPEGGLFAVCALLFYLAADVAATFAVFGVMSELPNVSPDGNADTAQQTADYQLLSERSPFLATMLGIGVGSLAGIPPTLGFVAKFLVIVAAFYAGIWALAGIALLCVAAGVYYYFAWIREAFQKLWLPEERLAELSAPVRVSLFSRVLLTCIAIALLAGGVAQGISELLPHLPK